MARDVFVPRLSNWDALEDSGKDGAQTPAHDDSHNDEASDAKVFGGEYAQIKNQDGNLITADGDFVWRLGDVKVFHCHYAVCARQLLNVRAVAVLNRHYDGRGHSNGEYLLHIVSHIYFIERQSCA